MFNGYVIGGRLNLRQTCSTSSTALTQIPDGDAVQVSIVNGNTEWFAVSYNGYNGFALARYIAITNDGGTATVTTASGALNVRKTPASGASVIYRAEQNATLRLIDCTSNSTWYRVSSADGTGWAMKQFLTITSYPGEDDTETFTPLTEGMFSDAVWEMQEKLLHHRYYYGHGDSYFDNRTKWAVKYFQHRNNLPVTGIVDAQTMNLLDSTTAVKGVDENVLNRTVGGPAVTDMKMNKPLWSSEVFDANNTSAIETIGDSGNGPCAIAACLSTLWECAITPPVICAWAKAIGDRDENGVTGVKESFFRHVAPEWDVRYGGTTNSLDDIINYLNLGGLCVVRLTGNAAHSYCSPNGATWVMVYKVDSDGVHFVNSNSASGSCISAAVWRSASWVQEAHLYGVELNAVG